MVGQRINMTMAMAVMIPNITIVTNGFFSMRPTMSSYIFWVLPNTLLKALNTKNFGSLFACRNRAHRAGVSVSELNPLKTVAAAIVRANCLYNWPEIPLMKVVGIKTASNTSTTPTIGPTISPIASVTASRAVYFPVSISRDEFSTTTIASSTTIAMARINPNKVNVLIENPKADMTASVPIRETGMVMQGMITARKFWRNRKITSMTRAVVSRKVTSTSSMEALITCVVSSVTS